MIVYIARDNDGELWLYYSKPRWNITRLEWEPVNGCASMATSACQEIKPGECRKFEWDYMGPPYDPSYGDEKLCQCGHPYERHFDGYEGNAHVGCKYCECRIFTKGETE